MNRKPKNPLGTCTEKEIQLVNISRDLSPKRHESLHETALLYAWQERIIEDEPGEEDVFVREIADHNGITSFSRHPYKKPKA